MKNLQHITQPKVSIITVCFNAEKTIEKTIQSILSQTYSHVEYLILDGQSTDQTPTVIERYRNQLAYYHSSPDAGMYDAMNQGIQLATGDIIGFLNADDVYASPDVIVHVVQAFQQHDPACMWGDLVYEDLESKQIVRYWKSGPYQSGAFCRGWSPPHPTFFVKKTVYQQFGGFDLQYRLGNDIELMMRLIEKHRCSTHYLPICLVKMQTGGISNRSWRNIWVQNKEILRACRQLQLPAQPVIFWGYKIFKILAQKWFARGYPHDAQGDDANPAATKLSKYPTTPDDSSEQARSPRSILVTGASGFIGKALSLQLAQAGYTVMAISRDAARLAVHPNIHPIVCDLSQMQIEDLTILCERVSVVVHLAARVHQMKEDPQFAKAKHYQMNVTLTQRLAQAARIKGVKQFIFLSSIKVNGESTQDTPFSEKDPPCPSDWYALSKWHAECALRAICRAPMTLLIYRIPLVIGVGVRGNLGQLVRWIEKGYPLPFGRIQNRRHLLRLENLCQAIQQGMEQSLSGCYLLGEAEAISTPKLIRALANALDKPPRLLSIPPYFLRILFIMLGKTAQYQRLQGNLEVDSQKISAKLGEWRIAGSKVPVHVAPKD